MSLYGNSFIESGRSGANSGGTDYIGNLSSKFDSLSAARVAQNKQDATSRGKEVGNASGFFTTIGGVAAMIPGGQAIGAGLGIIGAIIGLLK